MSVERKCDRCGAVVGDGSGHYSALLQKFKRGCFRWWDDDQSFPPKTASYDFCAECLREFESWVKRGRKHADE